MSRIGNRVLTLKEGVSAEIENNTITVKGPKGSLNFPISKSVIVKMDGNTLTVEKADESASANAMQGTTNAIIKNNMFYGRNNATATETRLVGDNVEISASKTYNITYNLTNLTKANDISGDYAWAEDCLVIKLYNNEGYSYPDEVTVTMGGVELPIIEHELYGRVPNGYIWDKNYAQIIIPSVVGHVVITASGVAN